MNISLRSIALVATQYISIILVLLSTSNVARSQAESTYNSGVNWSPRSIASGDSEIQLNADDLVPLTQIKGWKFGLKPFAGFASLSIETTLGELSNTVGAAGAMLNITYPARQLSFDIGWAHQYSDRKSVKQSWETWSLGHGLLMSFQLRL